MARATITDTCEMCDQSFSYVRLGNSRRLCLECRNSGTIAKKRTRIRGKYGLSLTDWRALHEKQGGACAICAELSGGFDAGRRALNVDHCHRTGKVRGLLCGPCNRGLGHFEDDPLRLAEAIRYLTRDWPEKDRARFLELL